MHIVGRRYLAAANEEYLPSTLPVVRTRNLHNGSVKRKKERERTKNTNRFIALQSEPAARSQKRLFVRIRKSVMHYIVHVCFCLIAMH